MEVRLQRKPHHVPRERIVATAVNLRWIGFERLQGRDLAGVRRALPTLAD
jgi:hypothetical protein